MVEEHISEGRIREDRAKADAFVEKKLPKVEDPLARFNLGQQHHWHPTEGSGLSPLPTYDTEGVAEALANPDHIKDPQTGQEFQVVKLNWKNREKQQGEEQDNERTRPIMYALEYGHSATGDNPIKLRLEELVKQTGRPVFSIDHPGMGSEKLTKEQKRSLKTDEGYGQVAEAELRVMKEMGIKDVDLVGMSMGAWSIAQLAEKAQQHGITVHNLVVMESPGVKEMSAVQLMNAEASEAERLSLYQSANYDARLREQGGHFKSALRRNVDLLKWGLGGMRGGGLNYIRAMARENTNKHLGRALDSNPDLHVQVINATESKVSPAEANTSMVRSLQEKFRGRIHQSVYSGDSHSGMENPQKFGTAVRLALQPSAEEVSK